MDAELQLINAGGRRSVSINDFFTGPGKTVLKPDELILEITIPFPKGKTAFLKLGRRKAMTLSVVNVATHLMMDGNRCIDARIALGSMAPTPLRCVRAEGLIKGKRLDEALIGECATQAVAETSPIDDQRATAWYRKRAGQPLVARALAEAAGLGS
jgi:carbon-monoxide dehydrogenase medium subunit